MKDEDKGVRNESADLIKRVDRTWTDCQLEGEYTSYKEVYEAAKDRRDIYYVPNGFGRLVCNKCEGTAFEVLHTGSYQTSAKCLTDGCGLYFIVHSG